MIFIFSEVNDEPTNNVIKWIKHYQKEYVRINYLDFFESGKSTLKFTNDEFLLCIDGREISLNEVTSVWYRRKPKLDARRIEYVLENKVKDIYEYVLQENSVLIDFFKILLDRCPVKIGSPFVYNLNKLEVLYHARELGFKIPDTLISNDLDYVHEFVGRSIPLVNKPISNIKTFKVGDLSFTNYTKTLEKKEPFLEINNRMNLFQERVDKKCEIRTFVLEDETFSMAIYDQEHADDYRENSYTEKLSFTKFKLPESLEKKVFELLRKFGLNTCSVDFLLNQEGEFIFLELNPVGQYGFLNYPNNYQLDKRIAQKLCQI